jgi:hypothetical protein
MKTLILPVCLLYSIFSAAQQSPFKIKSFETSFYGGIAFHSLTKDSLIPDRRRGGTNVGTNYTGYASVGLATKNPNLELRVGLGYSEKQFGINKYSLTSFLMFFNRTKDTFHINQIKLKGSYLSVPLGVFYNLARKNGPVQVKVGVQLYPYFNLSKKGQIIFDSLYKIPTAVEQSDANQQYAVTLTSFSMALQPRIDLYFRLYEGFGISADIFPFSTYINSNDRRLIGRSMVFGTNISLQYNLPK